MGWDEREMNHKIGSYLIRIMSTGRAPIGKYNLIQIIDSSKDPPNNYVTDLWKSEDTGEWTRHDRYLYPTQSEVDEWLRDKVGVSGMKGLLRKIGLRDEHFVPYM